MKNKSDVVNIETILFSGKRSLQWDEVELYLLRYCGVKKEVKETGDRIIIGSRFASEYCGSMYTKKLHGTLEKAKANAAQIIMELDENAVNRRWTANKDDKHCNDAKLGWYRYDVFFTLPVVFNEKRVINRYRGTLIARINDEGIYLHDIINIKKEDSKPFESNDRTV